MGGVAVNTTMTLRMNDGVFFLRLFKADTLRRLHIYLSDILKYAAKSWILNQGTFLKAS